MAAASLVATVHTSVAAPVQPGAVAHADRVLQHRADIRANGSDAYTVYRSIVDGDGDAHVRYTRTTAV